MLTPMNAAKETQVKLVLAVPLGGRQILGSCRIKIISRSYVPLPSCGVLHAAWSALRVLLLPLWKAYLSAIKQPLTAHDPIHRDPQVSSRHDP